MSEVTDLEKHPSEVKVSAIGSQKSYQDEYSDVVAYQGIFGGFLKFLDKFHIESRGIERVAPEDRQSQSVWDGFTVWAAANFAAPTFSTGMLGWEYYGLGFWDSAAVIIIVNFFCALIVAVFGNFGPKTGLRQIVITRYSFGMWGSRLLVVLNICGQVGWSAVNSMAGATLLKEVSNSKLPLWAGNLIIGIVSTIVCLFGYNILHAYQRYSWMAQVFVFCFIAGYGRKYFDVSSAPMGTGAAEAQGIVSFIASIYGFAAGWAMNAADYNVRMPENTNKWKLGATIWAGNFFSVTLTELLGAAFILAISSNDEMAAAFEESSTGGIMGVALQPLHGFGKFLLVIMAFSSVQAVVVNIYSSPFNMQNLGQWALKVPRAVWTLLACLVFIVFACAGAEKFSDILVSFLSIIGYYLTPFLTVVSWDFFVNRKGKFPLEDWNDPSKLPIGYAGVTAIIFGFVGAVLSMDQTWYQGVISKAIKPDGCEMGWIFSGIFALAAYIPSRYLEKKYTGR